MDFNAVLPPPGEEAHALSHAGEEMLLYQELDQLMNDHQNHHFLNHYYILISTSANFIQALSIINASTIFLSNFQASTPNIDFAADLEDECACLQALTCKKDETSVEVDYVKALVDLEDVQ
ncbi:uncharacterized protein F5891DRAFT_957969 [Suillus fuscotomentosus]|uniref:Uncharacterized protein n=1 Tax=Suillus fuscotomentosus TaxID=1912939 RepID=A0AAD4DZE5_9AGAM|nr:uncharacterized protein F5891DRAFT_957969 [Suillus fuscotomentosus]KAG1896919.1 hypothetical protein F5891DRAFT_957969 [Suillus fuscotomentosus]